MNLNLQRLWYMVIELKVLIFNPLNFSVILLIDYYLSFLSIWISCCLSRSFKVDSLLDYGVGDTDSSFFYLLIILFIIILDIFKILEMSIGLCSSL